MHGREKFSAISKKQNKTKQTTLPQKNPPPQQKPSQFESHCFIHNSGRIQKKEEGKKPHNPVTIKTLTKTH